MFTVDYNFISKGGIMIHLIGIGNDKGNITLNAFKAIKDSDIIINYDNIDLSFFDSEIKDKELISAIDLINGMEFEDDSIEEESIALDDESDLDDSLEVEAADLKENSIDEESTADDFEKDNSNFKRDPLFERILQENYVIEMAVSKSIEGKEVALIVSDEPSILGLSNRFLQIKSKYKNVKYRIYPGISSINNAASFIGAPLADFAVIDLTNPIIPFSETEDKIKKILDANLVLVIKNPVDDKREDGREAFERLKEIVCEFNEKLLTTTVFGNGAYSIKEFKHIIHDEIDMDKDTVIFIGNRFSYCLDGRMVTSSDYMVEPDLISWSRDFFEKYLNGESPQGIDLDCDYLPCHKELEACDFCYCPFYPCADGVTGGEWMKDKEVWSCLHCIWIHQEDACKAIREGLDEILENVDDLREKHIELLKLRRECLLKTLK